MADQIEPAAGFGDAPVASSALAEPPAISTYSIDNFLKVFPNNRTWISLVLVPSLATRRSFGARTAASSADCTREEIGAPRFNRIAIERIWGANVGGNEVC